MDGIQVTVDVGCSSGKYSLGISGNGGIQDIAVTVNWLRRYLELDTFMVFRTAENSLRGYKAGLQLGVSVTSASFALISFCII